MNRRNPLTPILLLSAALVAGASTGTTPWEEWNTLRLKARKMLFFTGMIQLDLRQDSGKKVLETWTCAKFLGVELARSRTVTTIDSSTGRTLEYRSLSRKRGRHYVFGEKGYTVRKLVPKGGFEAPLEDWEVKWEKQFEYPAEESSGAAARVSDYYGMILQLKEAKLEGLGDEVKFYVATSKGPQAYRVRVSKVRGSTRTFRDLRSGEKRTVAVREFRLRIAPDDAQQAVEGFLNIEGETELWVESNTRTLLQISGNIPKVPGRVEIELHSIG